MKNLIHRLRGHKNKYGVKATRYEFLTEEKALDKYHVVANICDDCGALLKITTVPNSALKETS